MNELLKLTANAAVRKQVYARVRERFEGVKALCAATVSEYLIRAGVLNGYRPWTADLDRALEQRGWLKYAFGSVELAPGDLVFTVDANDNDAPDHVFIFLRWLDKALKVAQIVDNYEADPHPRNLGAAVTWEHVRLGFGRAEYVRRQPAPSTLNAGQNARIKAAFAELWSHWMQLPPATRTLMNQLRRSPPFSEVP